MKASIFRMKRAGRYGTRAFAAAAILLVALILVNVLFALLPAGITRFDAAGRELTEMSPDSRKLVEGVKEEVTIYWLCEGGTVDTATVGGWFELLLTRYDESSRHVTVKRIDTTTDTDFLTEYGMEDYGNHSILVESARRSIALDVSELFLYTNPYINQMMYQGQEVTMTADEMYSVCQSLLAYGMDFSGYVRNHSSIADAKLAAAVDYVTREVIPHAYILTGYEGTTPTDGLKEYVGLISDTVGTLDLSKTTEIPADANCLILYGPTADLSDAQTSLLRLYLNGGGSLVLATSPAHIQGCPNIQSIAADFGLSALDGLVLDSKSGNYVSGTSTDVLYLAANSNHSLYSVMGTQQFRMPQSHAIAAAANLPTGVSVSALFSTSEQASRVEVGNVSNTLGDSVILNVAMTAQKAATAADGSATTAKLVWFGSVDAFSEATAEATQGAEYICFAMLAGSVSQGFTSEYDEIDAVPLATEVLGEMNTVVVLILIVVLVLILPIGLLAAGIVIWARRKARR